MSYRPADEGFCGAVRWGDDDLECVPGPTQTVALPNPDPWPGESDVVMVSVALCERCSSVLADRVRLPYALSDSNPWL